MAKTKQEIIDRLVAALTAGEGDLDALDDLMNKAKADIEKAKAEQKAKEEAEAKRIEVRGQRIADMATRVLNEQTTEEDLALVMESYMHAIGLKDAKVSAKDIKDAKETADQAVSAIGGLFEALGEVLGTSEKKLKKRSADDVIAEFLRTIG